MLIVNRNNRIPNDSLLLINYQKLVHTRGIPLVMISEQFWQKIKSFFLSRQYSAQHFVLKKDVLCKSLSFADLIHVSLRQGDITFILKYANTELKLTYLIAKPNVVVQCNCASSLTSKSHFRVH